MNTDTRAIKAQGISATPSEMEASMRRRCPKSGEVEALYRAREDYLTCLQARGEATLDDVRNLDRLGRCLLASHSFSLCTPEAAEALINDQHHSVRSCAALSAT